MYKVNLGRESRSCKTIQECVDVACKYRDETDMGVSTMHRNFGKVTLNGKDVFEIMYNGRVKDCGLKEQGLDDEDIFYNPETQGYYKLDGKLNEIEVDRSSLNFFK